jgi:hypothetical protein
MAGNFLKYGHRGTFSKTAGDLPVDSHQLLALRAAPDLCQLRCTGEGAREVARSAELHGRGGAAVFRLLGAKDLGLTEDYNTARMPAVSGLLDGRHGASTADTDAPNWKYFLPWADKFLHHASPSSRP